MLTLKPGGNIDTELEDLLNFKILFNGFFCSFYTGRNSHFMTRMTPNVYFLLFFNLFTPSKVIITDKNFLIYILLIAFNSKSKQ